VGLLLERGVEADSKDKYRQMPLSWVAAGAHEAVVQLFRSCGAGSLSLHSGRPSTRKIAHCTISILVDGAFL
jgi:hypothetical protein